MKKLSFAQEDYANIGIVNNHSLATRETEWEIPEDLAVVDLIELYLEIETTLDEDRGITVQFIGASPGPGSAIVALDMAWAAVSILGKKMLVLNCTRDRWTMEQAAGPSLDGPSVQPISTQGEIGRASCRERV